MISKGSCDTEDWSNDALIMRITYIVALNPVIVDKCGHRGLGCDSNFHLL